MGKKLVFLTLALTVFGPAAFGQTAELAHRWSFNGDLTDSVGGQDAAIVDLGTSNAILSNSEVTLTGGTKDTSDYVDLPDGILSALGDSATIEVWATQISVQNWSRIWDFGASTTENVFMSWTVGTTLTNDRVEWVGGAGGTTTSDGTVAPYTLGTEFHIVFVFQPGSITWYAAAANAMDLGPAQGTLQTTSLLSALNDTNCWIGRSQWGDNTANASYNEFRLWKGALTTEEMEKLHDMGPDTINASISLNPSPKTEATDVSRDLSLTWDAGEGAVSHDVYLGTTFADVSSSSAATLVSMGQSDTSFDPGRLEFGQTYYWKVDEIAADGAVNAGNVWSFTVEPFSYMITDIIATASSAGKNMEPSNTVDGSGLDEYGQHSTASEDSWATAPKTALPAWIQYEFDRVAKLDKMLVWNSNQAMESTIGIGAKDVTVEYSTDGETWATLGDFEFAQAPGDATCVANDPIDFGGVAVKFVKLTINSNWYGIVQQTGLSEVQFYSIPVIAREPEPADDANDVNPQVQFSWRAGREAASHKLYASDSEQAVIDGTAPVATVSAPEYDMALMLDSTYYWKVVEVNNVEALSTWASPVWSFSTGSFVTVDDFESYTDDMDAGETIYQAWLDGWGDDTNGAIVGYDEVPFAEQTVLHGGKQSMPLRYTLSGSTTIGEATIDFDPAQDWTKHGITTLTIFFHGQTSNGPVALYAKINNTKVSFNNAAAATALPVWKTWNIDLAATGASLKSVKSLTIGVEGTGEGTLFVDDIRLYATAPAVIGATDPGTTGLVAWYKMDGNVDDSSGKKYNGTLNGSGAYDTGYAGQALNFNGSNTYVDLPIGPLMPTLTNATVASFVYMGGGTASWERVFDFGTDSTIYMFLSPRQGTTGPMRFAIRTAAVAEQVVDSPSAVSLGWHHMAVSIDATTMMLTLYLDGEQVGQAATTLLPKDLGTTTQNWLGRSQYTADGYFMGMLDEFRIYNKVLTAPQIRYLAGDR